MKLLGLQPIDGGVAVAMPSGRQILVALPTDRQRAASVLGERILNLLDDPDEPHAKRGAAPVDPKAEAESGSDGLDPDEALAALDAGIEAGRLVWRTLQSVSRGRKR